MKICLDAGHYGSYNQSPAVPEYYEAKAMWRLHMMLRAELERRGIETVCTRMYQAEDKPLTERGKTAKGCDLFLSLHSNAVGDTANDSIDYPVAYVSVNGKADDIGASLAKCVEKVMETNQKARIEKRENSAGDADYYGVLRGAQSVGVSGLILEHSFHTNTEKAKWLLDTDNLRRIASAEADILARYLAEKEDAEANPSSAEDTVRHAEADTGTDRIRYKYLTDIPDDWNENGDPRALVSRLMEKGIIKGAGSDSFGIVLDLSRDTVRLLVMLERAGVFAG